MGNFFGSHRNIKKYSFIAIFAVLVVLFFSFHNAPIAHASNCVDANTCPGDSGGTASCPTAPGSTTFTAIPNTAYTSPGGVSIASVDCIGAINYDSVTGACPSDGSFHFNPGDCLDAFKPHGYANSSLQWILCWHGGGGFGGDREGCWGGGNNSNVTIQLLEECIDLGKPCGIINLDYQLSTSPGVGTFPAQFKDTACGVSWAMNQLGFTPATLLYYGPSWGSLPAFWAGNVPSSVYGTSTTCRNVDTRPANSRTVSAWIPTSWVQPNGSSFWENSVSPGQTAMEDALNCSNHATCLAADLALNATPYLQINNSNKAQIKSNQQMFQWTATDMLVEPYWSANTAGAAPYVVSAYQALGIKPLVGIYPNAPSNLNNYNNTGGHEIGLGNVGIATMGDAMNFLLNVSPGGSSNAGSAGVLSSF